MKSKEHTENPDCPCSCSSCERHGNCEACKAYHHSIGQKTSCEKLKQG